jgi:hypothetical protein
VAVKVAAHHDARIAEMAPLATVNQLHTMVRCSRPATPAVSPPTDEPADSVITWTSDDGRFHLRADLAGDLGRVIDGALEAACDRLRAESGTTVTRVDALVDVAERSMAAESARRRDRFRGYMFLDPAQEVPARWPDGTTVPDLIRDHLTCDGRLTPIFTDGAKPVSVGRTRRIVPDHTRRLVLLRDHACRVPWCGARRHLEVHHLDHWNHDGRTDYERLIALCSRCHRAHHHGLLRISGDPLEPDGLVFTDHRGRVLTSEPRTVPPSGPPPDPIQRYEHPLGERLSTRDTAAALSDPPQHAPPSTDAA